MQRERYLRSAMRTSNGALLKIATSTAIATQSAQHVPSKGAIRRYGHLFDRSIVESPLIIFDGLRRKVRIDRGQEWDEAEPPRAQRNATTCTYFDPCTVTPMTRWMRT